MKISKVEGLLVDRYFFVRITTDDGFVGVGESGAWGFLEASQGALEKFKGYLLGQDPLRIEHHFQNMYRWSHFRGAGIMGAISAIDIALWDIAGKHFGVPVYQLLGGKVRDKARVYCHIFGQTRSQLVEGCRQAKEAGFTAVGHLTPFLDESPTIPYYESHARKMRDAIDAVRQYREAVGDDVDLCIEIHRRLTPHEAIVLSRGIEQFHPMYIEDPTLPDNMDAMAEIAAKTHVPIATGERLHTIFEFEMLLRRDAVDYVRPDVCLCGGITHSKKIATLAEARQVGLIPHNPLSPISTAACIQIAACSPNFVLQEYPNDEGQVFGGQPPQGAEQLVTKHGHAPRRNDLIKNPLQVENGFMIIPDAPGIGVELAEGIEEMFPYQPRPLATRLHVDGSVVDQ
ncbi:MAG: galactonate dehydratase [Pirellulales bacterium]